MAEQGETPAVLGEATLARIRAEEEARLRIRAELEQG